MMRRNRFLFVAVLPLAGACATSSPSSGAPEGFQDLRVVSLAVENVPQYRRQGPAMRFESLDGVSCTLSNDKGIWTVVTPGEAHVALSGKPLKVECLKEGYAAQATSLVCMSDRKRGAVAGAGAGTWAASQAAPVAVAAAPAAGVAVVGVLGLIAAGTAVGAAVGGPGGEPCSYTLHSRALVVQMYTPSNPPIGW